MKTEKVFRFVFRPSDSFPFILALHILFLVSYVILTPAFEGADEPEHLRYIEAVYTGERIHPVIPSSPRRHGIEVYQPPLYYHMAALVARVLPVAFPDYLPINPDKNPNFPYLVHDMPSDIFPYDICGRSLRLFRTLSLFFGIVSFFVLACILRLVLPENPWAISIVLLLAALWPNNLQVFSVVSNGGMAYMLNLTLILIFLHVLKSDETSWKHGLCLGTTLAAGILTKMTILVTVAALVPVLLVDMALDKRRVRLYLKILPAVLLPVMLLAGPFIVSRIIWYGSPTGEKLLHILVPGVLRPWPLSFGTLVSAIIRILPGRFLADLCWQQMTLPFLSLQLFLLWFASNTLLLVRMGLGGFKQLNRERILHRVWVSSSFVLMFIGLYAVFAKYIHLQIRHVWNLWPMTLLAPFLLFEGLKRLRHIKASRILSMVFTGTMAILLLANLLVLYNFTLMCGPVNETSRRDLDYFVFMDNFAQGPFKADAYLDPTGQGDVAAYNYFIETNDWKNVLYHALQSVEKGFGESESRLVAVRALQTLGRPEEALELLGQGPGSLEARIQSVELLLDLKRFSEANEEIDSLLPQAPPEVRRRLEMMKKRIPGPRVSP